MRQRNRDRSVDAIIDFISEAGLLKRTRRSGWSVLGIGDAESVADHSFRCAVIGYFLAKLEGASSYRVISMALFNDMHEARITDLHKMAQRYFDIERAEDEAYNEQLRTLPGVAAKELGRLRREYREQKSLESVIARDADILECLIQAKEYADQGYRKAGHFMKRAPRFLKTRSAKLLWTRAKSSDSDKWWIGLSEFRR